jgi:hypothetical protein
VADENEHRHVAQPLADGRPMLPSVVLGDFLEKLSMIQSRIYVPMDIFWMIPLSKKFNYPHSAFLSIMI